MYQVVSTLHVPTVFNRYVDLALKRQIYCPGYRLIHTEAFHQIFAPWLPSHLPAPPAPEVFRQRRVWWSWSLGAIQACQRFFNNLTINGDEQWQMAMGLDIDIWYAIYPWKKLTYSPTLGSRQWLSYWKLYQFGPVWIRVWRGVTHQPCATVIMTSLLLFLPRRCILIPTWPSEKLGRQDAGNDTDDSFDSSSSSAKNMPA